ncbi:hypothetical protein GCM10023231_22660 [Olivibacter ginsenosidimutans]|uniref:DUF4249 domain-containing protein n=1 Tax=Olivibacter ginsenosidimutans TaxID=1176537 RepID=A0ABP9BCX2_9SPHI
MKKFSYSFLASTSFFYWRILWGIGLLGLSACEKVIDIDLKDSESKIVIEGNVSDQEDTHYVYISKTVPFSASGTYNPVQQAVVDITESVSDSMIIVGGIGLKTERTFAEVSPGVYQVTHFKAYPGRTYTLHVKVGDEEYTASSTMPMPVMIDSIGTVTDDFFGDDGKTVGVVYQDPPGVKNYYRYLVTLNGKPTNLVFAYNDKYNDGKQVQRNLYHEDLDLKKDDAVMVEQLGVDEAVYRYFNGIQSNNPGAAAPANPVSNFSNGALGYFSAHTVSQAATIIQ